MNKSKEAKFNEFVSCLFMEIYGSDLLEPAVRKVVEEQLSSDWEIYHSDEIRDNMLSLDVKYKGSYGSELDIEDYFNSTKNWLKDEADVTLVAAGRNGGHWGIPLRDILAKPGEYFKIKHDPLFKLWKELVKQVDDGEEYPEDVAYEARIAIEGEDSGAEYFELQDWFMDILKRFENDINMTSDAWENERKDKYAR